MYMYVSTYSMCMLCYVYTHIVLTGSEQQMKQTLKDYLKGDWLFPWDRSEEEEKQHSGNAERKQSKLIHVSHAVLGISVSLTQGRAYTYIHFYCSSWLLDLRVSYR